MSSSDTDPGLAEWFSKLNHYREAINASPDQSEPTAEPEQNFEPERNFEPEPIADCALPVQAEPTIASTASNTVPIADDASVSLVEHLPIDGLLKRFQRTKSFVLGIGSMGQLDPFLASSIVSQVVTRCAFKTERKAILVSMEGQNRFIPDLREGTETYQKAVWQTFGESKADMKAWNAQLGALPRWKQEFGLIVVDLGDAASPQMLRIARLCDGIVMQLFGSVSSRDTIRTLKNLKSEGVSVLGAWSVGLRSRPLAA